MDQLEPLRGNGFRVEVVMGMPMGIDLRDSHAHHDPGHADAVLDRCFDRLRLADQTFSLWHPETPMARLRAARAVLNQMPVDVIAVLRECVLAARETSGWFSARDPEGRIDPTGLVKGWAVAQVGDLLLAAGYRRWCISAAGDVLVHGQVAPDEPWVVGVADPDQPGRLLDAVHLGPGGAVATSGTAERGGHIWDPLHGNASHGVRSASVVCTRGRPTDILRADVLATATVARGPGAIRWLEGLPDVDALVVDEDGRQHRTSGWVERSVLRGDS